MHAASQHLADRSAAAQQPAAPAQAPEPTSRTSTSQQHQHREASVLPSEWKMSILIMSRSRSHESYIETIWNF